MKERIRQKDALLIFVVMLLICGGHSIGYAHNTGTLHFESASTTRSVVENTGTGQNIGTAVEATAASVTDTLTYSLSGTDAASFDIVSTSGQLQTKGTLDYETKNEYSVTVGVSDGTDTDSITVTISITDVPTKFIDENGDIVTFTTRSVRENTPIGRKFGEPFLVQDDLGNLNYLTRAWVMPPYTGDSLSFVFSDVDARLKVNRALDFETKDIYKLRVSVINTLDNTVTDTIRLDIHIIDVNETAPVFDDGASATRQIVENSPAGTEVGDPVAATDEDTGGTLTYSLSGTEDAPEDYKSFTIDSETGQLRTKYPLDYEFKNVYNLTVIVVDDDHDDPADTFNTITIPVTINVTDLVPTFIEGDSATRSIAENTARGTNIGDPVTATGPDIGYTLTYSLSGTTDAPNDYKAFAIDTTTGQLITEYILDYEDQSSYTLTVSASDGNHPADTITVTINVTDETETTFNPPAFVDGSTTTRSVKENLPGGTAVGHAVQAHNIPEESRYALNLNVGDHNVFNLDSDTGQLTTKGSLDHEANSSYSVTINLAVSNGHPDMFSWPVEATTIVTINVENVNEAPIFADTSTVRSIPQNTVANQNIGAAVAATDPDLTTSNADTNPETPDVDDVLTYTLGGDDAASFNINSATGQLTTKTGITLTVKMYNVTVTASDSVLSDTIAVQVDVTTGSTTVPTVIITGPTTVRNEDFNVTVIFSEAMNGFTASDITPTLTLTAGSGTASTTLESGSDGAMEYTVKIDLPNGVEGSVAFSVPASAATNTANTGNTASAEYTVPIDTLHPRITITGVPTTALTGQFSVVFTFSEPVIGFEASDIIGSSAQWTVTGSGAEYIVTVTPTTSADPFSFGVRSNAARDAAGNGNFQASTATEIALGSPTVTLTAPTGTQTGIFDVTITFSENVTGFEASDILMKNSGMTTDFLSTVTVLSSGPRVYTATITPRASGDMDISVPANVVQDTENNGNSASSTQTVTVTLSGPAVTITGVPTTPQNSAFDVTISFSEEVTNFMAGDISLGAGVSATVTNLSTLADSTYFATITPADNVEETIMLSVPAGVAISAASENNLASSVHPIRLDKVDPTVNITGPTDRQTGAFDVTIIFSETVTDFMETDILLTGSTATATITEFTVSSRTTYIAEITPTTEGDVLISVPASAAQDEATNDNTASTTLTVSVDFNDAPVFDEGDMTTRIVAAIASAGEAIGDAVSATDPDILSANDANPETTDVEALTYHLGGADAMFFNINSVTGQLLTMERAYNTQSQYMVIVTVSDGTMIGTITVAIDVALTPVCDRTPAVRDAIVAAVSGVTNCADVTETHLAAITSLDVSSQSIIALKAGDFDGLTVLTLLSLNDNSLSTLPANLFEDLAKLVQLNLYDNNLTELPANIFSKNTKLATLDMGDNMLSTLSANVFDGLTALTTLDLDGNELSTLPVDVFDDLTALQVLILTSNDFTVLSPVVFSDLTALTTLNLDSNMINTLGANLFDGLTALSSLSLSNNKLSTLSRGVFEGLTGLSTLNLDGNTVDPLPLTVSLKRTAAGQFKATAPTGAPFNIVLPVTATNGTIGNSATSITIAAGSVESSTTLTVTRTDGTTDAVTVDIGTLPGLPVNHQGYELIKSDDLPLTVIDAGIGFTDGDSTTRSVAENTAAGTDIGTPVAAMPIEVGDTLTYDLSGTDAASFDIVSTSGQLQTKDALDYEAKNQYSVTVGVSDGTKTASITVAINITDVNETLAFPDTTETTLAITQYIEVGADVGMPISASDRDTADGDTDVNPTDVNVDVLTYTLSGTDAASFDFDTGTGQLKAKEGITFDRSVKNQYSVTVSASDGEFTVSTTVTINVVMTPVCDRTPQVRDAIVAAVAGVADCADVTEAHLAAITTLDVANKGVTALQSGDFDGLTSMTILRLQQNMLTELLVDLFDGLTSLENINLRDNSLTELPEEVFDGLTNLDRVLLHGNRLTELPEEVFDGLQLTQLTLHGNRLTELPEEVFDGLTALRSLQLQDNMLSELPEEVFDGLTALTNLQLQDNMLSALPDGIFEGLTALTTLDLNGNTVNPLPLTVSLKKVAAGEFKAMVHTGAPFNIVLPVSATNGTIDGGATTITIPKGSVESTSSLTVTRIPGTTDPITVDIGTLPGIPSDHNGYELVKSGVLPLLVIGNNVPTFTEGDSTTRSIVENTAAGENIGAAVEATDADATDTLTYTLSGTTDAPNDYESFSIVSTSGQLQPKAALDYETKSSYEMTVGVSDGNGGTASITVTINITNVNEAPAFTTETTTRYVVENASAGRNIGAPVVAVDPDLTATNTDANPETSDADSVTYTLGGTDVASFDLNIRTGQLKTKSGVTFDRSAKDEYSVTVTASDGTLSDSIEVTISITEQGQNTAPTFADGASTTRSVAENRVASTNIGTAVEATDADASYTLTYSLSGTTDAPNDYEAFSIVTTSGQLQTKAALDYETKSSYEVSVDVSDGNDGTDSITVTISIINVNEAPAFATETTTRSVAENTAANTNIGDAVAATDPDIAGTNTDANPETPDADTLTYTLGGTDATSFSIVSTSGQLQTKGALDFETDDEYEVTVTASDGTLSNSITVAISITNKNEAPAFVAGTITRSVPESTEVSQNIGALIPTDPDITGTNTDANPETPDADTLNYTLSGTDAASFEVVSATGQLRTKVALDYENKDEYEVTVIASDGRLSDSIDVTINVTDVNEAPTFPATTDTTLEIAENTTANTNIGTAVAATDPDTADGDTDVNPTDANVDSLTYSLDATSDAVFNIDNTGQLKTEAALDYETTDSYTVTVTASDGEHSVSIEVTISITNVNEAPEFATDTTTRSIAENTAANANIGDAVAATDPDIAGTNTDANPETNTADTLTYTLGGTDAASFAIVSTTGQLQTSAALDYETKDSYVVTVGVSDGTLTDSIEVTIDVDNVNEAPTFPVTTDTTLEIAENTASNTNIGTAITATGFDATKHDRYILEGDDAASFSIGSSTGQLKTSAALDYETKSSYTVIVTIQRGIEVGGVATYPDDVDANSITVAISITNKNEAPAFPPITDTTLEIAENTAAGTNIGDAVAATDPDIAGTNTDANPETPDADTLTYTLGGTDGASFDIVSTSGQLQTKAALDFETDDEYEVTVTASDGTLSASVDVTISITDVPVFTDGESTTRSVAENTAANQNIGTAVTATGAGGTLTYSLTGTEAASFDIDTATGQLQTKSALDYETKNSYSVTVGVTEGTETASITVAISITDVNEAPTFPTTTDTTLEIAENTAAGENIGTAVTATDPDTADGDTDVNPTDANVDLLTYSLDATSDAVFDIESSTGQLKTEAALDFETDDEYEVTVTASDGEHSVSIEVTIGITDVDETLPNNAPTFPATETGTRSVAENTATNQNIGAVVAAMDADIGDTLTYSLSGTTAAPNDYQAFSIVSSSGQLQTNAALDYETKNSYSVTVEVSDGTDTASITVTISITNVNEAPEFATDTTTRSIAENTAANANIGATVAATDPDIAGTNTDANPETNTADTLTYTLGGTDAASFAIVSTTGQLQTSAALDYEMKDSYVVTVGVSDGTLTDSIEVTIDVDNVNEAPTFPVTTDTTLEIAENTASNTNIGTAVTATGFDATKHDRYILEGDDAASFSIGSSTGQLKTSAALDYETKSSYSVIVIVQRGIEVGGVATYPDDVDANSITVAISITNKNEAPAFATGTTTRSIAENTAASTNIGTAVAAADPDIAGTNTDANPETSTADALTYTLSGTDAASFDIVSTSGQLQTKAALDYENKNEYEVTVTASDGTLSNSIDVTINITDVNEAPTFPPTTDTTLEIAENTTANTNIGTAVAATDPDTADGDTDVNPTDVNVDSLTYSIDATSDAVFDIESSSGQLKTEAALDYETTDSYTVTVTASDGALSDSIDVTISITNVDEDRPTVTITAASAVENNPQNGAFEVTITFSEAVNGFTASDITLTTTLTEGTGNATVTLTSGSDGDTEYTAEITPPANAEGEVEIQVPADVAQDAANQNNTASSEFTVDIDTKPPTVTITNVPLTTQNDGFEVTITFSEGVTLTGSGNITAVDSVSRMYSLSGSGTTYTATFSRVDGKDGDVKIKVPAGFAKDSADNENTESGEHTVSVDWKDPTVTVTVPSGTQTGAFDVTITFSESVTGFAASDISLSGTASATATLTGSGTTYTAEITPTTNGNVVIQVPADAAEDAAENGNTASQSHTVAVSLPAPTVTITGVPTVPQNSAFDVTITFSETVTGFDATDISLGTNVNATVTLTGSGTTYTATITPANNVEEEIAISVPAGAAQNAANTDNTASAEHRVQLDRRAPSVTITGPTTDQSSVFDVTITFSEAVTGFAQGDISLSGTATATATLKSGSSGDSVYVVTITPTSNGNVVVQVSSEAAVDAAGNGNPASQPYTVTVVGPSTDPPSIVDSLDRPKALMYVKQDGVVQHGQIVAKSPFELIIKFGQPVTGFEQSDLRLSNSSVTITGWVKSDDSKKYTVTLSPSADGSVTFTVPANVTHAADDGQGNIETKLYVRIDEEHEPTADVEEDKTAPSVRSIRTPLGIQIGAFDVTITFSESVTGFTASDITLSGTANARVTALTGSGSVYTATITPDANADGNVTIQVPAGAVKDEAENENTASRTSSVRVDLARPTVEIKNVPTSPQNSAFSVTIIFSSSMTGFEASDIILGGTANATVTDLTGSRSVYTATITPTSSGTVTIQVPANAAQGSFNRRNTASETHSVTVDLPSTTVTISVPSGAQNSAFSVTIIFSNSMTGFEASDITLGGTANATVTALTGSGRVYTATITPTTSGNVSIQVPANAARDSGDHGNIASSTRTVSVTLPTSDNVEIDDRLDPIMSVSQNGIEKRNQTVAPGTFQLRMNFGQPVTGFERSELGVSVFEITVTITGWRRSSNRKDYIATIRVSGTGGVMFTVPENAVQAVDDGRGNPEGKFTVIVEESVHSGAPLVKEGSPLPNETLLLSNYPNPFNPETWIPYQLAQDTDVEIRIYDVRGTVVRRLALGYQSVGFYTNRTRAAYWDGRNDQGEPVSNGVYFYQLHAGDTSPLRKMLMLK